MSDGIPQVQTGKRRDEHVNVKHMLPLPADTPFGNLSLKYTLIVERLDHVNGLIDGVFDSYQAAVAKELGSLTHHLLLAEEATYWLRKTADELLALVGVLAEREASGSYPAQAASHPIDAKSPPAWVVPHLDFLRLLNEVSNAYKHSFINSDALVHQQRRDDDRTRRAGRVRLGAQVQRSREASPRLLQHPGARACGALRCVLPGCAPRAKGLQAAAPRGGAAVKSPREGNPRASHPAVWEVRPAGSCRQRFR